jgi:hypothetical protein
MRTLCGGPNSEAKISASLLGSYTAYNFKPIKYGMAQMTQMISHTNKPVSDLSDRQSKFKNTIPVCLVRDANSLTTIRSTSEHTYRLGSNNVLLPGTIEVCHTFNRCIVWLCCTWCEYYFRGITIDKICNLLYKEKPKYIISLYKPS